jgi:hypothetical protein
MIASKYCVRKVLRDGIVILQRWHYIPNDDIANVMDCIGEWVDEEILYTVS